MDICKDKGYSLVELIVVMAIFIVVILVTNSAFESILKSSATQSKMAQSNIEGIVGLELMRADLEAAGFGLPWSFQNALAYTESQVGAVTYAGVNPDTLNDAPNGVPRALSIDTTSNPDSDYLVIRSTPVSMNNDTAKKWSYVVYSSTSKIKTWPNANDNLQAGDRVITINELMSGSKMDKQLAMNGSSFYYTVPSSMAADNNFSPGDSSQTYVVYGLGTNNPTMPFNRADYYVHRPADMPTYCAVGSGSLYKVNITQAGVYGTPYPLLDCVLSMQVVFTRDQNNDGNISYTDTLAGMSATDIRTQIKTISIYILAQEGRRDLGFTYPQDSVLVGPTDTPSLGRTFDNTLMTTKVGADWKHYRWKVYQITVHPKNLTN